MSIGCARAMRAGRWQLLRRDRLRSRTVKKWCTDLYGTAARGACREADQEFSAIIEQTVEAEMTRRPIVLVVEDDAAVRAPLEKFLALNGFDVVSAETADAALDRLGEQAIDAAIVDLRLGQGSGREVIVSIPPPRPVIIFSAVPDESGRLEQIRPNTRLIQKPFSLLMLVETLQKMMAAAARKDPAATRISTRVT
jgi:CheY-like chemotaxis protein